MTRNTPQLDKLDHELKKTSVWPSSFSGLLRTETMVSSMGDMLFRKIIFINQEVTKMNEYARLVMVSVILTCKEI